MIVDLKRNRFGETEHNVGEDTTPFVSQIPTKREEKQMQGKDIPVIKRISQDKKVNEKFEAFNESVNCKVPKFDRSPSSTIKKLQQKLD